MLVRSQQVDGEIELVNCWWDRRAWLVLQKINDTFRRILREVVCHFGNKREQMSQQIVKIIYSRHSREFEPNQIDNAPQSPEKENGVIDLRNAVEPSDPCGRSRCLMPIKPIPFNTTPIRAIKFDAFISFSLLQYYSNGVVLQPPVLRNKRTHHLRPSTHTTLLYKSPNTKRTVKER